MTRRQAPPPTALAGRWGVRLAARGRSRRKVRSHQNGSYSERCSSLRDVYEQRYTASRYTRTETRIQGTRLAVALLSTGSWVRFPVSAAVLLTGVRKKDTHREKEVSVSVEKP